MLKRIILIALATILVTSIGCGEMLNQQSAKDRDLAHMVEENMKSSNEFMDFIVSFEYDGKPGHYLCVTKGITDPQIAGKFAYNAMVNLDERNNTKVKTGRSEFVIVGEQSGEEIYEVVLAAGSGPRVTLKGPFEGEIYEPSFK